MNSESHIVFFVLIVDRKKKEEFLKVVQDSGGRIINTLYGKGSASASTFMDIFGFYPEEHKIVITSVMLRETADLLFTTLIEEFYFERPNTGFAFTIPVEGLSY